MRIIDFEKASALRDVAISLTREEAEDLAVYLNAMLNRPRLNSVHLSEVARDHIEREIRFDLQEA